MSKQKWMIFSASLLFLGLLQYVFVSRTDYSHIGGEGIQKSEVPSIQSFGVAEYLFPGELPGYTGWARPEHTLARFFEIENLSTTTARTGDLFSVDVSCNSNQDCPTSTSTFFLRAYGPSITPGTVENKGNGRYTFQFRFIDPGIYTVEAVLTFSDPPPIERFPLAVGSEQPAFEGYMLPSFPLVLRVAPGQTQPLDDRSVSSPDQEKKFCKLKDMKESTLLESASKARWRLKSKSNTPLYVGNSTRITKTGYKHNVNSLGIQMEYQYKECSLLPEALFKSKDTNTHPFNSCNNKLHVVFIGDSVLRVQKATFDEMIEHLPSLKTSYVNLYGGFRKVQRGEPSLQSQLEDVMRGSENMDTVILFNTGLHDIHRLCAEEWREDRFDYIPRSELESETFSCIKEYRDILNDFATMVTSIPAKLRVFQTTTAGWPKYGNFGINWPMDGQRMPLTSDVIPYFNKVAHEVMSTYENVIQVMDGYWVTYSRPDNREVGEIGNKLSHPGLEVQSAMARIFGMMIRDAVCGAI